MLFRSHSENTPSNAIVSLNGAGGETFSFENIINQGSPATYIDASSIGLSAIQVNYFTLTQANQYKAGASGESWIFLNCGAGDVDITSSTHWVGGTVPPLVLGIGRTVAGDGIQLFASGRLYLGSGTVLLPSLPTSASGLATGQIWNNSGVLNVK